MTLQEKLAKKLKEKQEEREAKGEEQEEVEVANYAGDSLKGKAGSGK